MQKTLEQKRGLRFYAENGRKGDRGLKWHEGTTEETERDTDRQDAMGQMRELRMGAEDSGGTGQARGSRGKAPGKWTEDTTGCC